MSVGKQVIRATPMFKSGGMSDKVSATKEIVLGMALGVAAGLGWQTYHWKENERWDAIMGKK
jgi:hypothetical protein